MQLWVGHDHGGENEEQHIWYVEIQVERRVDKWDQPPSPSTIPPPKLESFGVQVLSMTKLRFAIHRVP